MEATHRRPQLPALSYLDVDKSSREEDAYQSHNICTTQNSSLNITAAASPTCHYPPDPPPPYSHTHHVPPPTLHANKWQQAAHTPPESRRTSEHEQEGVKRPRQSLPSISEALGLDSKTSFAPATAPPPVLQSAQLIQPHPVAPRPASPTTRRSYAMEPPQALPASFPNANFSQYSHYRPEPPASLAAHQRPAEVTRTSAAYPPVQEVKQQVAPQPSQLAGPPAPSPSFPRPSEASSMTETSPSQPPGPTATSNSFAYGYTPYPPRYANPTPPSSVTSGPIYQPSVVFGPQSASTKWKPGASQYDERQSSQANHSDNVKRHLDFYDLEAALNEIASTSGILSDFSRRYGDRMHQTQRSGPSLSTLPGLVEVDDMVAKTRVQLDSLLKIREVTLAQQAAHEQQAADQRYHPQTFKEDPAPTPEHSSQDAEDDKTGAFTSLDAKKRRGRAAPPGRCHSCNRAETPEWRRGPDGARTLCNACGLHYAKLTRKNNGANKNSTVGSSNLRPKEDVPQ